MLTLPFMSKVAPLDAVRVMPELFASPSWMPAPVPPSTVRVWPDPDATTEPPEVAKSTLPEIKP